MNILKWYAIILTSMGFIASIYKSGKNNENIFLLIFGVLVDLPIIVYLILS